MLIYTINLHYETMLEILFTSRARARLIVLFFSEPGREYWLREAARAVDMNINAVRREVLRLEEAGILTGMKRGNQRVFRADFSYPLFPELLSMVEKKRSHAYATSSPEITATGEALSVDPSPDYAPARPSDPARARTRRGICYQVDGQHPERLPPK